MAFRILCTGDVHLGRSPARIPEGMPEESLRPVAAWRALVDRAIQIGVDVVALTGDVVDEDNCFYEAFSPLESGVRKLVGAGVRVVGVSGNHDHDVLPRLAGHIPEFRLLGSGGRWEEVVFDAGGAQKIRFVGWSFPARRFSGDSLADFDSAPRALPTIALLHCDCDVSGSPYGPVSLAELRRRDVDAWLLGHVHKPAILWERSPLVLYPGSLQGLDPSETGAHGAWLVTVEPGRPVTAEILPSAPLRWEAVTVPLDGVAERDALDAAVIGALDRRHGEIRTELGATRAVGCRLFLNGRARVHRRLQEIAPALRSDLRREIDGVEYFIEKVEDRSRPEVDLEDLARSHDPAGLLAARLLLLDRRGPAPEYEALLGRARKAVAARRPPSDGEDLTDGRLHELLVRSGMTLLDELLAQKESPA